MSQTPEFSLHGSSCGVQAAWGWSSERSRELGRPRKGAACFHGESWRTSGQLEERVVSWLLVRVRTVGVKL